MFLQMWACLMRKWHSRCVISEVLNHVSLSARKTTVLVRLSWDILCRQGRSIYAQSSVFWKNRISGQTDIWTGDPLDTWLQRQNYKFQTTKQICHFNSKFYLPPITYRKTKSVQLFCVLCFTVALKNQTNSETNFGFHIRQILSGSGHKLSI